VLLALREHEAVLHEGPHADVELAHGHRVFAAVGERDHTATFGWIGTVRAAPDPVRLLGARERIDVEHRRPLWLGRAIARERRAAPDAPHMRAVLPEVE